MDDFTRIFYGALYRTPRCSSVYFTAFIKEDTFPSWYVFVNVGFYCLHR